MEYTEFDDLALLSQGDLKAVFKHISFDTVVFALWGCSAGRRGIILRRLPSKLQTQISDAIQRVQHLSFEQVRNAQQQVATTMCELSRSGVIAFDAPEDMVA